MKTPTTTLEVQLGVPEATELTLRATQEGILTPEFLGIHVLRSAYGALHPTVVAFEKRPKSGQSEIATPGEPHSPCP